MFCFALKNNRILNWPPATPDLLPRLSMASLTNWMAATDGCVLQAAARALCQKHLSNAFHHESQFCYLSPPKKKTLPWLANTNHFHHRFEIARSTASAHPPALRGAPSWTEARRSKLRRLLRSRTTWAQRWVASRRGGEERGPVFVGVWSGKLGNFFGKTEVEKLSGLTIAIIPWQIKLISEEQSGSLGFSSTTFQSRGQGGRQQPWSMGPNVCGFSCRGKWWKQCAKQGQSGRLMNQSALGVSRIF